MGMNTQLIDILELLARTPSADNSQPWRFVVGESFICCHSLPAEQSHGPFGPLGHATLLSAGAMHESMHQLFGDDARIESVIDADRWAINLTHGTLPDPKGTAARRLAKRHTNRLPYTQEPVVWPKLSEEWPGGGKILPINDPASISAIGAAVKTCSAARFNCQELHEWLFSSLRWNETEAARGDGLDIASLHLPPGGKQFMRFLAPWRRMQFLNRFGLYKVMAMTDARLVVEAPAIVAIVGQREPSSIWAAGRIMQASWVALNAAGFAVHPYYVVTDIANRLAAGRLDASWRTPVEKQLERLGKLLGLMPDSQIHMLLRVGTPSRAAKPSARLPLERLLDQPAA
jgi:hypothetical protein